MENNLAKKAKIYLNILCEEIKSRPLGSPENQFATNYFANTINSYGFDIDKNEFDCIDWEQKGVKLYAGDEKLEAFPSPYSEGCEVIGNIISVESMEKLQHVDVSDEILLLHKDIARQRLTPKNHLFNKSGKHKKIISLLEEKSPAAIITVSNHYQKVNGKMVPYPIIEDGDFNIPSVYISENEVKKLLDLREERVFLQNKCERIISTGFNVIASKGKNQKNRLVLLANIDTKIGSPGASNNASGITILLLLAELLKDYKKGQRIEIVAINGGNYFSNPGGEKYLELNSNNSDNILVGIDINKVGFKKGRSSYSLYNCPVKIGKNIRTVFDSYSNIVEKDRQQKDSHNLFLIMERPSLELSSERIKELNQLIINSEKDIPALLSVNHLVHLAHALHELILKL